MPDISMCLNNKCPLKETCHRFTAIPGRYAQSFSHFEPDPESGVCDYFIDNKYFKIETKNGGRDVND